MYMIELIGGALWCVFPKKPMEFVHKIISKQRVKVINVTFIWNILLLNAALTILS